MLEKCSLSFSCQTHTESERKGKKEGKRTQTNLHAEFIINGRLRKKILETRSSFKKGGMCRQQVL